MLAPHTRKAVVLLSGGLDSSTVVAMAQAEGFEIHALTVIYGQRHEVEIQAAKLVAKALRVSAHKFVSVDLNQIGGSALTSDIEVPKDRTEAQMTSEIPVTYVPARNTIMLSLALAYAEVVGSNDIFVGVNAVDYSGYPDCRPEFVAAFEALSRVATKAAAEGESMTIHAPLINMTKAEIIEVGQGLGVDYSLTHSCYDPIKSRACGRCDSCQIRNNAFASLGLFDPALAHL